MEELSSRYSVRDHDFKALQTFEGYLTRRAFSISGMHAPKSRESKERQHAEIMKQKNQNGFTVPQAMGVLQNIIDKNKSADQRVESREVSGVTSGSQARVVAKLPEKLKRMHMQVNGGHGLVDYQEVMDIARGVDYLRKFDALSKAFKGGKFDASKLTSENVSGPKMSLELPPESDERGQTS